MKWKVFIVVLLYSTVQAQERILFASGDLGYECFRIPALVQWEGGELFAFAEGRKSNCANSIRVLVPIQIWPPLATKGCTSCTSAMTTPKSCLIGLF